MSSILNLSNLKDKISSKLSLQGSSRNQKPGKDSKKKDLQKPKEYKQEEVKSKETKKKDNKEKIVRRVSNPVLFLTARILTTQTRFCVRRH